jgi:hypothetical protein
MRMKSQMYYNISCNAYLFAKVLISRVANSSKEQEKYNDCDEE